jgi:hypothetical protein
MVDDAVTVPPTLIQNRPGADVDGFDRLLTEHPVYASATNQFSELADQASSASITPPGAFARRTPGRLEWGRQR